MYLLQLYDKENKFSFPPGTDEYYVLMQWIFFAVGLLKARYIMSLFAYSVANSTEG
jgi:hypothetical protein